MRLDQTAIGIALGLAGAACYAALRLHKQRSFDVGVTVLVFLGLFSLPGGIGLIRAGMLGDLALLPAIWREEVAIAGIVTIGLSAHFVVGAFRAARARVVASRQDAMPTEQSGISEHAS